MAVSFGYTPEFDTHVQRFELIDPRDMTRFSDGMRLPATRSRI